MNGTRRRILSAMAGTLGLAVPGSGLARAIVGPSLRAVTFENLHTGERLKTTYWADGGYQADALRDIAWVLRDHRANAAHPIDLQLLEALQALGRRLGRPAEYQVISGYRSSVTNAMLAAASEGVAPHSLHTQGMAIDIRVRGVPTARVRDAARSLRLGGVGYYPKSDFVHVDTGRVRYW